MGGIEQSQHEALVAAAVARAVAEERARWQTVQAAVSEVQQARRSDDAFHAERARREAELAEQLRATERARAAAAKEAAQLGEQLRQAEEQLRELKGGGGGAAGAARRPATAEPSAEATPRSTAGRT